MLTTTDLDAVSFTQTKWREGYDTDEVDAFLDRVVETLRAYGR